MELMHRALPRRERYPLPPRQVTMQVATRVGADATLDEVARQQASLLAHFGYGGAMGALYGLAASRWPVANVAGGVTAGLAVWTANYLGLLPALDILPPATQHPVRRSGLMIAAHVLWGGSAGYLLGRWLSDPRRNAGQGRRAVSERTPSRASDYDSWREASATPAV
jgi:uncharacterized membrane protein YagU involved in acid resistance